MQLSPQGLPVLHSFALSSHFFPAAKQVSPQGTPLSQTLQHWSAGMQSLAMATAGAPMMNVKAMV